MLQQDKYGGRYNLFKYFAIGIDSLRRLTKKRVPWLHCVMFGDASQCFWSKAIFGFMFGALVGIVFYDMILIKLPLKKNTIYVMGAGFTLFLALGCAASSQIRCITLITIPSFAGKTGRAIIQAMVVSIIITGPISNIVDNLEELMRMHTCTNYMAYNLSQARYDLLVKPFKLAFLKTKLNTEELKDMLGSVNNVVEPFAQEIEGVDDLKFIKEENDYMDKELNDTKRSEELDNKYRSSKRAKRGEELDLSFNETNGSSNETADVYQQKYYKKLETRCENVKTGMGKMCKKRFQKFKEQCEEAVHWAISWAVCWPMKLDVICDLVKVFTYGGYDCDPSKDVSDVIGKGYVKLKNSGKTMQSKVADERVQYKIEKPPNFVDLHSAYTITREFSHEVYTKKTFANGVIKVAQTILAFMFILTIKSATQYYKSFICFTDFDNIYITADFRVLDAKRRKMKKATVLPLTKAEKRKLTDPYSLCLGAPESEAWNKEFTTNFGLILVTLFIFLTDVVIIKILQWMKNNLEFSYTQMGYHAFGIDVQGIGFVASIVRSIIKDFDFNKVMESEVSNKPCLPIPKFVDTGKYKWSIGLCTILLATAYLEGYIKRLRRAVCAFYYREQEKRRIESLYKKTLTYRHRLIGRQLEILYKNATKTIIKSEDRLLYSLYEVLPCCIFCRVFSCARSVCVTCKSEEPILKNPAHQFCNVCRSFYCAECWANFYSTCFVCTTQAEIKRKKEANVFYEDIPNFTVE